jgi:hypothetical protein
MHTIIDEPPQGITLQKSIWPDFSLLLRLSAGQSG